MAQTCFLTQIGMPRHRLLQSQPPHLSSERKGESCQLFIHLFPLSTFQLVQHLGSICEGVHRPCRLDGFTQLNLYFILSLPLLCYTPSEATSCKNSSFPCRSKRNKIILDVGLCPDQQPQCVVWQPVKEMPCWRGVCAMKYSITGNIQGCFCLLVATMAPSSLLWDVKPLGQAVIPPGGCSPFSF